MAGVGDPREEHRHPCHATGHLPEEAVLESVRWLIDHGRLDVANPLTV